MHTGAQEEM